MMKRVRIVLVTFCWLLSVGMLTGCGERVCTLCEGNGRCRNCLGTGEVLNSWTNTYDICPSCAGTGVCPQCHGAGKEEIQ